MTREREEAIKEFESELKWAKLNKYPYVSKQKIEADKMAIKALEQEPCEDAISRAEAIRVASGYCHPANIAKELGELPPVLPEQNMGEWIPVSERLPEDERDVLICNKNGDIALSRGSYSTEVENDFIWYTSGWRFGKVIAWIPLPEPYKAESEDKE